MAEGYGCFWASVVMATAPSVYLTTVLMMVMDMIDALCVAACA